MANNFAKLAINAYNLIDILSTRELSKNTPKNVIKLLNKFPY
ncbi:hypothetical protein [Ligilactobacillus salivarius]